LVNQFTVNIVSVRLHVVDLQSLNPDLICDWQTTNREY